MPRVKFVCKYLIFDYRDGSLHWFYMEISFFADMDCLLIKKIGAVTFSSAFKKSHFTQAGSNCL